jgi:hypothetical protein
MWAWFRAGLSLQDRLRPSYVFMLSWPQVAGLLLVLPLANIAMQGAFAAIGVSWDEPVQSTDNFPLALALLFLVVFSFIILGCAIGLLFVALGLRYVAGWSWRRIWNFFSRYEVPDHWLLRPEDDRNN